MYLFWLACLVIVSQCGYVESMLNRFRPRSSQEANETNSRQTLRQIVSNGFMKHKERNTVRICYESVGCFELPHAKSPLQKTPEPPQMLGTKFYLFRRDIDFAEPNVIYYDDHGVSLDQSKFDPSKKTIFFVHGYMSKWNEKGAFVVADAYLKLEDVNFVLMDWTKGARGPQYAVAASNTEVAGRQLGILLMNMMHRGSEPSRVHIIGFSLGAHVAASASEMLKLNGKLVKRITGLDVAGPLFKYDHLKQKSKKLDISDAQFVDVLHTDSSPFVIDGFGLWESIGHVDFFANGGQEQPGCTDQQASVVVSSLDRTLTRDSACSHIRAALLYIESVVNKARGNPCEFIAFKCPGGYHSFRTGQCFPQIEEKSGSNLALDVRYHDDLGIYGEVTKGDGMMFFVTRDKSPFCGTQMQGIITTSSKSRPSKGHIIMELQHGNSSTPFKIHCEVSQINEQTVFYTLAAVEYGSYSPKTDTISAQISFVPNESTDTNNTQPVEKIIYLSKISVRDMKTNTWSYCGKHTIVGDTLNPVTVKLQRGDC